MCLNKQPNVDQAQVAVVQESKPYPGRILFKYREWFSRLRVAIPSMSRSLRSQQKHVKLPYKYAIG